jgi:eukaryotic-like serine/threonine-protein kinase
MIGSNIAHYEIIAKLGEGGMGVVYKARDTHLDRFVAIKILPPEKVTNADRKARFVQEARSASALNHPNIVHIYDIDQHNGVDFMAMEFVAGKTLDALIPRKGLRLAAALDYSVQIAGALAAAHEAGIVHRDVKPGNVIVGDDGRVRVLDFGLAKLTEAIPESDETRTALADDGPHTEEGTILGTVSYMSPEQAEGRKLDARSDIFSFGSVLYEMVTGHCPFQGDSSMSTLGAIIHNEPEELSAELPHELKRLIERCLRKDSRRRFQHMDDVRIALEDLKEESETGVLAQAPVRGTRRTVPVKGVAIAAAAIALCGAVWYWVSGRDTGAPAAELVVVPLTTYPGMEVDPSFSPDGRQVAFSWNGPEQNNFDIYVRLIGTGEPLRLTSGPEADFSPAWSPDGQHIAFVRPSQEGALEFYLVPSIGGRERKLWEMEFQGTAAGAEGMVSMMPGPWVRWSPDGEWLALPGIGLLSVTTGEARTLTNPPEVQWGDFGPAFSPDGRSLAFVRVPGYGSNQLMLIPLSDDYSPVGEPRLLTSGFPLLVDPVWTADGKSILFSSASGGERLWRIESSGREPARPVASFGDRGQSPDVAQQLGRLAYERQSGDTNIWRVDLTEPDSPNGGPVSFIASTAGDAGPAYSPDGRQVIFSSSRTGSVEIWACGRDGANSIQLTSLGQFCGSPRWSPDGKWVAFDSNVEGKFDVYVVGAEGGAVRRLTTDPADDARPAWSGDGEWIYFHSDRDGTIQIWKMPAGGGEPVQVTRSGGGTPQESTDGRFVYYTKGPVGALSLWKTPVDGGVEAELIGGRLSHWDIQILGRRVFFTGQPASGRIPVEVLDVDTGEITSVTTIPFMPISSRIAVSPDGRTMLYEQVDQSAADLMLVENFR